MELLFILLLAALGLCIFLALCICCFANSRYCHCVDYVYDAEDTQPIKTKTATSRELNQSEYYSNSTPILGSSSKVLQQSDFGSTTNGHQYTPLAQRSSKPLDGETTKTTFYTSPDSHSSVSETSYSTRRNVYPSESSKYETSYSTTRNVYPSEPSKQKAGYTTEISYSSETTAPYQVTTRTSSVTQQPQSSPYSEDAFYQTRAPQYALKKSSSQTSLYENN